jgi:aryl-alcohol dehydrogenase-like predicted oxidoreductase
MELALGTVQFGLRYGVAGRGSAIPPDEARAILRRAHALGIRVLDTASAYGDIEARLGALTDGLPFHVVSKLPPCPPELTAAAATAGVHEQAALSCQRLGPALRALLFHRAEDLLGEHAEALWTACAAFANDRDLRIGVSCYDVETLNRVAARFPVEIAQVPGNALDQRLRTTSIDGSPPIEVHLRSAFLQGLLLMPCALAAKRVSAASVALARWHAWCSERNLAPLVASLGVVKGLPSVSHCVVGVDNMAQLDAIVTAWHAAPVLHAPELQVTDACVIDPRRWPVAA